jgi:uncharacterized OB-fold protein
MTTTIPLPVPRPTPVSAPFWEGLRERKVRIQYSPSSDRWVFYPRLLAPGTLADDLEWREVSGEGVLYTFTIARKPTAPQWKDAIPQLLAIVELDEGPRLTTELVDVEPDSIHVGMRVRPVFHDLPDSSITLLRYTPA